MASVLSPSRQQERESTFFYTGDESAVSTRARPSLLQDRRRHIWY